MTGKHIATIYLAGILGTTLTVLFLANAGEMESLQNTMEKVSATDCRLFHMEQKIYTNYPDLAEKHGINKPSDDDLRDCVYHPLLP